MNNDLAFGALSIETRCDLLTADDPFINTNESLAEDAIAINDEDELKAFLSGTAESGYLVSDISFDWDGVGAIVDFAENRTLDGRGHTVILSDKEANANVIDDEYDAENINCQGYACDSSYGLFVRINEGTIKNIKFVFDSEVCAVNNGEIEINYVGIICGENRGSIEKCDLNVSGKFAYFYIEGEQEDCDDFQTHFGGFAGTNSGCISNVYVCYDDFLLRIRTKARTDRLFGVGDISAKTFAGGVAGSITDGAECSNIIVSGKDLTLHLTADTIGNGRGYKYFGAVAAINFDEGKVDNIIVDVAPKYVEKDKGISKNAVVHCGQATNVTALCTNVDDIDMRSSNCDCPQHIKNHCNIIEADEFSGVNVYINEEGKQVVDITPIAGWIESLSFIKYRVASVKGDIMEISEDDTAYISAPTDFRSQDFQQEWVLGKTFEIIPYQTSSESFWRISVSTWRKAEIEFSEVLDIPYTGEDVFNKFVRLKMSEDGSYLDCDFTKMNLTNNGEHIYEATDIGDYIVSMQAIQIDGKGFLFYDEEKHIYAVASDKDHQETHRYSITPGRIVPLDNLDSWANRDFVFKLEDGIAGAADGLVYCVDARYYAVDSLVLSNLEDNVDREYSVFLTKKGKRVSEDYVFIPKIDTGAPIIANAEFLNPIDGRYYTENIAVFSIYDSISGIRSVKINDVEVENVAGNYFVDLPRTGRYVVKAEDIAGNVATYEFYAYIDRVVPTLRVTASDDKGQYISGKISSGSVNIEATATFGESGGTIEYRIDGSEWNVYNDMITISSTSMIEFCAISNTSDGNNFLTSEIIEYQVVIIDGKKEIVVTADWFVVDNVKEYDGTDVVKGIRLNEKNEVVFENFEIWEYIEFSARFADVNAGDSIEIIIDVWTKENINIKFINQVRNVVGAIKRKKVRVTLDRAESTYGDPSPIYYYDVEGVLDDISLDFATNANIYSVPDERDYRFWLADSEFGNYIVENFDELNSYEKGAKLIIHKAVISQLANKEEEFIDLDTDSAADLKINFSDVIDRDVLYTLDVSYLKFQSGAYLPIDSMSVEGVYKIRLFMPKDLQSRYILDESLYEIEISVKEAPNDITPDEPSNDPNVEDKNLDEEEQGNKDHDNDVNNQDIEDGDSNGAIKSYGNIVLAVGATSAFAVALGVLKKVALNKRGKKRR